MFGIAIGIRMAAKNARRSHRSVRSISQAKTIAMPMPIAVEPTANTVVTSTSSSAADAAARVRDVSHLGAVTLGGREKVPRLRGRPEGRAEPGGIRVRSGLGRNAVDPPWRDRTHARPVHRGAPVLEQRRPRRVGG